MSWEDILKNQRPDYPDTDGDGNTEEPMVDALQTVEEVESVEKSPDRKHYTIDGKEWTGKTHKMPNGNLMTEDPIAEMFKYLIEEMDKDIAYMKTKTDPGSTQDTINVLSRYEEFKKQVMAIQGKLA